MLTAGDVVDLYVNRRVGGLESEDITAQDITDVNRRVGGLENRGLIFARLDQVNRRVGGLESARAFQS